MDEVFGPQDAAVTVVAFLDRASEPSEASVPFLAALVATDPDVRVVIKELPLMNRGGVEAARTAVAVGMQGERAIRMFEAAMLASPGPGDATTAAEAAHRAGLDMERIVRDRSDPSVNAYLERTRAAAFGLGVDATPTFIVGHHALVGLQDLESLRAAVAKATER